ncbi:hypothetical protein PQJ75_13965 [Rhodoplanes sp. TEM]|uniref:Uncharacterized protein n=1 Tax=Rhodoplanes tepidamans TaxID=200616 RepID=A0ABT5JF04_RHOTP|nr:MULTISPECIES: hypothetical protein [Rhodoplanes]MDC7787998.1 hypothetical protein [Rhodoplanes tepidamans]MDC7984838.1 hypothetical protein [Rhodoplanes sp. TEM]MDQ0358427.1 hypothetical protein [Rhodoplanes tepidamans]
MSRHPKAVALSKELVAMLAAHLDDGGSFPEIAGAVTSAVALVLGLASRAERAAVVETIVEKLPETAEKMAVLVVETRLHMALGETGGGS